MAEISARLKSVTPGAVTQEFSLRRNQLGQLGFHVQHDGLITEVENFGYAWQTGLRQGSRLVEICKHPVCTLTHEQMVDLLKTSMTVTVTVIPPHPDGSPRQGCNLTNCSYTFGGFDGDYENVNGEGDKPGAVKTGSMQTPSNGKMRYERSLSPPRSSSSSGYGTGSSSKSFIDNNGGQRYPVTSHQPESNISAFSVHSGNVNNVNQSESVNVHSFNQSEGTMTSSSSGHSTDERWYDFMDQPQSTEHSPPPLPTRIGSKPSAFQKVATEQSSKSPTTTEKTGYQAPVHVNKQRTQYNGYESGSSSDTVKSSSTVHITASETSVMEHGRRSTESMRRPSGEPMTQPSNTRAAESNTDLDRRSAEAKSTYLTDYELNNNRSSVESDKPPQVSISPSYLQHNRLAALKTSPTQHNTYSNVIEANSEASETNIMTSVRSEDELSGVSSHSPHRYNTLKYIFEIRNFIF